jgi:23S rRNA (uracil1939-C5)-methyltransferase
VTPLCTHFGICGGCDWQHLSYAEQLALKRRRLADLLAAALGRRAPVVEPVIPMPVDDTGWPWRFRHKASFVFDHAPDGRGTIIGHYAAASRKVIPIVECPVHANRANRIAFALHARLLHARIPAAGPALSGVLRHLIVRTTRDDREAVAMLVVTRNEKALRRPIRAFLESAERPTGFFLNIHDRPSPYMVGRETIRLDGRAHVRERIGGQSYLVSPTAFFQTNADAAEILLNLVTAPAPARSPSRMLDLYAGSGLFTVALAARGHRLTAIEENARAVEDAAANLRLNRVEARLIHARVEDALPRLGRARVDLAVLDPPRQGCPPAVIEGLFGRIAPSRVAYVSCNPDALASELPAILDRGYAIDHVQPVDMFPHTTHTETLVTLRNTGAQGYS